MDAQTGARRRRRGIIFVFAIMALTVLLLLGVLSLQLTTQTLQYAAQQRNLAAALHAAEAVADLSLATLTYQPAPPTGAFNCPAAGVLTLTTGYGSAVVTPWADNTGQWLKKYRIVATGHSAIGGAVRTVIVQVRQQSFALYAYFTDEEQSSVTNSPIWFYARDRVYGPTHSNDQLHVAWDASASAPIFYDTVSSTADTVAWGSAGTPSGTTDWQRVLAGGQAALTLSVPRIALPSSTDLQRNEAYGAVAGFPTTTGVYLPAAGTMVNAGIYVVGDCQVVLSDNSPGNAQIFTITQGTTKTTITADMAANTTTVVVGTGTPKVYTGQPNGLFYCTGNITSLSGMLADNYVSGSTVLHRNGWSIVADAAASKNIFITNNLQYRTEPNSSQPSTSTLNLRAATLGVVAHTIELTGACPNNVTIDGVMMAGSESTPDGSFWFDQYNAVLRNNLNLLGGIIQKQRGPVGTFNQSTNQTSTGYTKNYKYDTRMVDYPPPYYPTTGQYDEMTWQYR